ncbi:MAG: CotH kinase family protein, partial [Flavobacteriaceae bacterium]|nr:CotH kinase family protein [Flavobacteriaceae bacterium]
SFLLAFHVNAQDLFDDSYLHEIRITSDESNIWNQLTQDYNTFYPDVPYRSVTIEIDGNLLEDIGVRQKGFSSHFFCPTNKKPIKLNFGKFVEDQEYDGVKKLNLANGIGDPAILKDKIVYDMYRMHGIPGPRVAHAKVYINDVYWGIYGMIEQIDKRYLKRNFADNDGNLWKNKGESNLQWQGTNPNNYSFELQTNETENDWTKFIEFIDFINNSSDADFQSQIDDIFDLDEYIRILAIDILTNNWDSYIEHGRNWYLYHEPKTDKIHWLPWDYNFAFDRAPNGSGDFYVILNNPQKVLIRRIMQIPEFKDRYLNYMCEILDVNFIEDRLNPLLDAQLDLLDDDWDTATNNFFSLSDIEDFINGSVWNGQPFGGPIQSFRKFIEDRIPSVEDDLANENYNCIPLAAPIGFQDVVINEFMASNGIDSPWFDQDEEHDDWVELYNNTDESINLSNYFLSDSQSFIHKWEFPDVSIPANGYLIVWADKDPQQEGLHTKFNLDSGGDEIYLSYLDGTIIDSVDYDDEQGVDKSLSRIPNGTGDFIIAEVTFNSENTKILAIDDFASLGIKIYPNPANTNINIDFSNEFESNISIHDILGREVYNSTNNSSNVNIDVSNLSSGLYMIRLYSNTYNISKKIVIN